MPERAKARVVRIATPIQGSDAYVSVKSPTWGQLTALDKGMQQKDWNIVGKTLADLVVDWNWVDYDGNALPLPAQGGVLNQLSTEEVLALSAAIGEAVTPPLPSKPGSSGT